MSNGGLSGRFIRKVYPEGLSGRFIRKFYPEGLSGSPLEKGGGGGGGGGQGLEASNKGSLVKFTKKLKHNYGDIANMEYFDAYSPAHITIW